MAKDEDIIEEVVEVKVNNVEPTFNFGTTFNIDKSDDKELENSIDTNLEEDVVKNVKSNKKVNSNQIKEQNKSYVIKLDNKVYYSEFRDEVLYLKDKKTDDEFGIEYSNIIGIYEGTQLKDGENKSMFNSIRYYTEKILFFSVLVFVLTLTINIFIKLIVISVFSFLLYNGLTNDKQVMIKIKYDVDVEKWQSSYLKANHYMTITYKSYEFVKDLKSMVKNPTRNNLMQILSK